MDNWDAMWNDMACHKCAPGFFFALKLFKAETSGLSIQTKPFKLHSLNYIWSKILVSCNHVRYTCSQRHISQAREYAVKMGMPTNSIKCYRACDSSIGYFFLCHVHAHVNATKLYLVWFRWLLRSRAFCIF